MDPLMQGWLTKSPPEKKTQGPWKLFKAKWRRRFFVLYEIPAAETLPGHRAALVYFDSDNLKHKLGTIDLSSCDEVQQRLESSFYQHVFSLRSKHKGKDRTYYLVANTECEMNKWVNHLCCVLGLKETEHERTLPTMRTTDSMCSVFPLKNSDFHQKQYKEKIKKEHHNFIPQFSKDVEEQEPYIPLDECWTGYVQPHESNIASPLNKVPPPPLKNVCTADENCLTGRLATNKSQQNTNPTKSPALIHTEYTNQEVYDKPRTYFNVSDESVGQENASLGRESNSSAQNGSDGQLLYDLPRGLSEVHKLDICGNVEDEYDIPPSRTTESRRNIDDLLLTPPKEYCGNRYMNLPVSSKCHPSHVINCKDPKTASVDMLKCVNSEHLNVKLYDSPPPPDSHTLKKHKYVNTLQKSIKNDSVASEESVCVFKPINENDIKELPVTAYEVEEKSGPSVEYHLKPLDYPENTAKDKSNDCLFTQIEKERDVCNPLKVASQSLLLFPNHRTRSFKRNICSSPLATVLLPTRKDGHGSGSSSNEDTDDIDEEDSGSEVTSKLTPLLQMRSLESMPPPPPKNAAEIQYLDLDLQGDKIEDADIGDGSLFNAKDIPQLDTLTDYREIDFIKTKALGIMKQDLEKKRKSSDKSPEEL